MILTFKDIPVHVLTIPGNEYKIRDWKEFKSVDVFVNEPLEDRMKSISVGSLHIHSKASVPYLASDDDSVSNHETLPESIEVPDDADIVLLINSIWRGNSDFTHGEIGCIIHPVDDHIFRVENMLGMSVNLVCTERARQYILECLDESSRTSVPPDLLIAKRQCEYNVYTFDESMFYQSGYNEPCTRIRLREIFDNNYLG